MLGFGFLKVILDKFIIGDLFHSHNEINGNKPDAGASKSIEKLIMNEVKNILSAD